MNLNATSNRAYLSLSNLKLKKTQVPQIGHLLTREGLHVDPKKVVKRLRKCRRQMMQKLSTAVRVGKLFGQVHAKYVAPKTTYRQGNCVVLAA